METKNKQRKYDEKGTVSCSDWLSLFNQILVFDYKLQIYQLKIFTHLFLSLTFFKCLFNYRKFQNRNTNFFASTQVASLIKVEKRDTRLCYVCLKTNIKYHLSTKYDLTDRENYYIIIGTSIHKQNYRLKAHEIFFLSFSPLKILPIGNIIFWIFLYVQLKNRTCYRFRKKNYFIGMTVWILNYISEKTYG